MKKFVLSIIIAAGGLLTQSAHAQVGVNVGVRIGPLVINLHKPVVPAVVYDDFYYLPEVDAYYSVPERCYYYNDGYNWVNAAYLPGRYRNYDWRSARRYEVRTARPYANHEYYRNKFGGSRNSWDNRGGSWGNDQYANRQPNRRDDRNNRPFPSSPYDSNNAGGRYNQPNRGNDNRGGWNGGDRNNDNRGNDNRGGWNGGDRNNDNRDNDNRGGWNGNNNAQPGRNNGEGGYGQPSNNNGGDRNQGGGRGNNQPGNQGGDRGGNRGNGNSNGGVPSRQHFAGNLINDNNRLQRGIN